MNISESLKATLTREQLIKAATTSIREKKSNAYLKVSSARDKLDMNKLLNSDDTSELREYLDTLEC